MKRINAIIDISGGMNELGKMYVLQNSCRYLIEYDDVEIKMFAWNDEITEFSDIESITPSNTANLTSLSTFIEKNANNDAENLLLLIGDGNYKSIELTDFSNKIKKLDKVKIRTIAIGADTNKATLRKISTNSTVYASEDIYAGIQSLLYLSDKKENNPLTINEIIA
jgi:hypothetical protein